MNKPTSYSDTWNRMQVAAFSVDAEMSPLHRRLLGDLIEYAIERGLSFSEFLAVLSFIRLPVDDHARCVIVSSGLRRG